MAVLGVILLIVVTATAREYTDEELSTFPELFYLDDYERCLASKDGLYCLGTFDLTPHVQPHPIYELLKVYSDESYRHFNRTRIHRGYCVSTRCPQEAARNTSQRFENCVDEWARTRTLRASINTLFYCHTYTDKHAERPTTTAQQMFLQCIYAIIAINIIATIYDVYNGDDLNKNKLITVFSIPRNWRSLTAVHNSNSAQCTFVPLNGIRAISMFGTTFLHANLLHYAVFTINPEYLERLTQRMDGVILFDGTSLMQILLTMSCFFTTYNLLMYSKKRSLNLFMLPLLVIKRVVRIAPVTLLVVGFGATWWSHTRDGPLMPITIDAASNVCQSKFWTHVFFINNIVEPTKACLIPTWFLPVDMHMYIVACTFTLIMWRRRHFALKLYSALFLTSCVLIAIISYIKGYKSVIYIATPEEIRNTFHDTPSFTEFYTSSWGALPSCFLGLILAHIQFELEEKRIMLSEHKWFVYLHYSIFPFFILWSFTGLYAYHHRTPIFYAFYILFDKPLHCIFGCITILGLAHVDGPLRRFFSWSGWSRLSRLSLTVMSLHWCVNMMISVRPMTFNTSALDVTVDWIGTCIITYALAVPITLLVEIPMVKFIRLLIF